MTGTETVQRDPLVTFPPTKRFWVESGYVLSRRKP